MFELDKQKKKKNETFNLKIAAYVVFKGFKYRIR